MNRTPLTLFAALAWLVLCSLPAPQAIGSGGVRTVQLNGPQAPGLPPGVTFDSFGPATLNDAGATAVLSGLRGADVTSDNNIAAWSEGAGTGMSLVTREDTPVPGGGTGVFFTFSVPILNRGGQSAFQSTLRGPGVGSSSRQSVWRHTPAGVVPVVRSFDQAVGVGPEAVFRNVAIRGVRDPVFNDLNQTAFHATYSEDFTRPTDGEGIWLDDPATGLKMIARSGSPAPLGTPSAPTTAPFGRFFSEPVLNPSGTVAFRASLASLDGDGGVWRGDASGLAPVAIGGQPAPGIDAQFGTFSLADVTTPVINAAGETAFRTTLAGSGVTTGNDTAIWSEGGGQGLRLVAREGQPAPGTQPGVRFASLIDTIASGLSEPLISDSGATAFRAELVGPSVFAANDIGLWRETADDGLLLVAREGDPAPGAGDDVTFRRLFDFAMNDLGQVAFTAEIEGPGIRQSQNDFGIWATRVSGELQLIARTRDLLDVSDDPAVPDLREIGGLSLIAGSGGSDGRQSSFNSLGQLAFSADFRFVTEGVFVTNAVAIPEPASGVAVGVALAMAPCRRRR